MDYNEFATKIKDKYPQYKDVDNLTLAQKIVAKYPQYSDVEFPKQKADTLLSRALGGVGSPQQAGQDLSVAKQIIGTDRLSPGMGTTGQVLNALEGVARVGRMGAQGIQQLGEQVGPTVGKYAGMAARFLLPQDKLSAAAAIAASAGEAESAMEKASKQLTPELARTRVIQPTQAQRLSGHAITVTTAIPERYASAVVADPSILSDSTPSVSEVSKEYAQMFDKMGEKFDTKLAQKYLNKNYIPGETEAQTLNKNVFKLISKLEDPNLAKTVTPAEAFLGRSQAAALQRSTLALRNSSLMSYAKGAQGALDQFLENNGAPEIKDLSAKYFRAIAKEQFDPILPKNKNMSPNALRGLIALKLGSESVGHLAQGNIPAAAGKAIQMAATSPLAVGSAIRGASAVANPATAYLTSKAALDLARKRQEQNQ